MAAFETQEEAMHSLLESREFSDLVLACPGKEFPVHRAIICPRSTFFYTACSGDFKEASSNRIELVDDDPATVEQMISYLYTFDYDVQTRGLELLQEPTTTISGENPSSSNHHTREPITSSSVRVYAIAEKYGIPALKELAKERFCHWAESNWDQENFADVMREVYDSTHSNDRGLRDIAVRIVVSHADNLVLKAGFRLVMEEIGELGFDTLCRAVTVYTQKSSAFKSRIHDLKNDIEMLEWRLKMAERKSTRQAEEVVSD